MVMMTCLVCLLRDQTAVLSASPEPESEGNFNVGLEVENSLNSLRETVTAFKGVLATLVKQIPALESRVNTLERMFKASQERWETLEATLTTNNESSEVREMVNSIVRRMEGLENMTVGLSQQRVDVRENATCGTCAATSITAELMAQIISTVRNQSGESSGPRETSNTSSNCADIVERSGFDNQNFYTIDLDGPGRGVEPMEVRCDLEGQTG
ncbi:uncharacterized protein LOC144928884 [Branchiostoma floridae x Branchiostoma belcheri]